MLILKYGPHLHDSGTSTCNLSSTSAHLALSVQVMSILFEVESLRVRDPRNILQVIL